MVDKTRWYAIDWSDLDSDTETYIGGNTVIVRDATELNKVQPGNKGVAVDGSINEA